MSGDPRRRIPGVDSLMATPSFGEIIDRWGEVRTAEALRAVQGQVRGELGGARGAERGRGASDVEQLGDPAFYAARVRRRLERADTPSLRAVINATGVVLHTNLGRAPLAEVARQAVLDAMGYGTLEYDLEQGRRGSRYDHCTDLLRELTGAEDALVVNNNAAAVVLALDTLARGRPAVISRGELVEIGGSFRVPEIMARSGAVMREVGATNRTHLADYRSAVEEGAAVVLKVHRSNFRLEGFTSEVEVEELAALTRELGVPLVHDQGSGALVDLTPLGLPHTRTARESIEAGADVVTMSGDKLLGGPQAGILVGSQALIARMRTTPLCRALRPDKLTLAALEATLALYRDPERARQQVPALRMLGADPHTLRERAEALAGRLTDAGVEAETVPTNAPVGGGAYPGVELPGTAVAVGGAGSAGTLAGRLRGQDPPVVVRVHEGRVLLDPRTVDREHEEALLRAVVAAAEAPT